MQADTRILLIVTILVLAGCKPLPRNFTPDEVSLLEASCHEARGISQVENGIASGLPRSVTCRPKDKND